MITERTFKVPIFDVKILVVIADSVEEARQKYPDHVKESTLGVTSLIEGKIQVILPRPKNSCYMVHELEHVKNFILDTIDHIVSANNDEVDAYLIEYLYSKVDKIVKEHLKNSNE